MGYSLLVFISIIIMVNLFLSFQKSFNDVRIKMKRQREQPIYEKNLQIAKNQREQMYFNEWLEHLEANPLESERSSEESVTQRQ